MSDTDKTRPYWVRVRDNLERTVEHHNHESGECDYDTWRDNPAARRWNWFNRCGRSFSTTTDYYYGMGVPAWFINHTWNAPERMRERVGLDAAAREYNSGYELEDYDFENFQHRHRSGWYWN